MREGEKKSLDSRPINISGAASCVYFTLSGGASQLKIVLQSGALSPGTLTVRMLPPSFPRRGLIVTRVQLKSLCYSQITTKRQFDVVCSMLSPRNSLWRNKQEEAKPFTHHVLKPQTPNRGIKWKSGGGPFRMTAAQTIAALIKVTCVLMALVISLGAAAPCQQQQWKIYSVYQ